MVVSNLIAKIEDMATKWAQSRQATAPSQAMAIFH
jgi:hypothetical protein